MSTPVTDVRRAYRSTDDEMIGGVAAGLAEHLRLPVLWVRIGFVAAALAGGIGIAFYAGLWMAMPSAERFETAAPGIESATRGGRRGGPTRGLSDAGPTVALLALGLGVLMLLQFTVGASWAFWPVIVGAVGVGLLWRQADEAQRERWFDTSGRLDPFRMIFGSGGWAGFVRIALGLTLVAAAVIGWRGVTVRGAGQSVLVMLVVLVGLAVIAGPWVYRLASDLTAERAERVRTQERADLAAHLHDSVLQTLALIQKNANNGPLVARMARSQERDLRSWLYADERVDSSTIASALRAAAADVEDTHGISIDLVAVGDCEFAESLRPIVDAAREAMVNAAKHAGTDRADVYAEITPTAIDVFVRDRGLGFDPDVIADDRHGVTDSILARMERHGGSAHVVSAPGEGTEVRLHLGRSESKEDSQ